MRTLCLNLIWWNQKSRKTILHFPVAQKSCAVVCFIISSCDKRSIWLPVHVKIPFEKLFHAISRILRIVWKIRGCYIDKLWKCIYKCLFEAWIHQNIVFSKFCCVTGSSVMFVYDQYFPYISVNFHSNVNPITDSYSSLKILLENILENNLLIFNVVLTKNRSFCAVNV